MDFAVESLADFVRVIDAASAGLQSQPWWRGQARARWDLVPRVFRDLTLGRRYETNVPLKFMQRAPTRHVGCPDQSSRHEWLFLMQHYGLPTRLLDWTESPLVAAFFAVAEREYDAEDGALWIVDPFKMASAIVPDGGEGLSDPRHARVKKLIDRVFDGDTSYENYAVGIVATEVDLRMLVQQAAVMVHGSPKPLNEYDAMSPLLSKVVIRSSVKSALRSWLARVGVRERSLFPDLAHLASDLARDRYAPE